MVEVIIILDIATLRRVKNNLLILKEINIDLKVYFHWKNIDSFFLNVD